VVPLGVVDNNVPEAYVAQYTAMQSPKRVSENSSEYSEVGPDVFAPSAGLTTTTSSRSCKKVGLSSTSRTEIQFILQELR
jgi:hypothetical protein